MARSRMNSILATTALCAGLMAGAPALAQNNEIMPFNCESGAVISVQHGAGTDGNGIVLSYRDRKFELYPVQSAGDRFATEQGLSPDHGLRWEMDGNTWHLTEMVMDHTAPAGTILESCVVSEEVPATTPANAPDMPVGTWQVTKLPDVPLVPGHEPVATFDDSGRISGNTGCNNFGSQAKLTATGLLITNGFMTRMGCEAPRHAVEQAFLKALESTTSFKLDGNSLVLLGNDATVVASLERLDDSAR